MILDRRQLTGGVSFLFVVIAMFDTLYGVSGACPSGKESRALHVACSWMGAVFEGAGRCRNSLAAV